MRLTRETLKKIIKEELEETLQEGILQQMEAEKILRDEYFRVRELYRAGKATEEEVSKAYKDMTTLDRDQFYTADELDSFEKEAAARDIKYPQPDPDARPTTPTPAFSRQVPGPDGEVRIQGIPMMSDEDDDRGLYEGLLYEGDDSLLSLFEDATLEEGSSACGACLFEQLQEASCGCPNLMGEAEYQGRKVTLNKPMRGDVKKFKVYVKDPKTGNVKKVNFGDPNMKIKKSNPKRRKSFRARHNCDNPGPKTKARYWSCKKW